MDLKSVEKQSTKSIGLGTILGYVALILSVVSGLVCTPLIKEAIGKSNYGLYTLSTSLVNLFLIDFGLSATINTFLAKYRAKGDEEGATNFLAVIYRAFLIVDAIIFLIFVSVYFCIDYLYVGLTASERESFKAVFLIASGFSVLSFPCTVFSGVMQAYERFIPLKAIDIAHRLIFIGTSMLAIFLNWGLLGVVIANFGSALLCYVFRYIYIKSVLKIKANFHYKANKAFIKSIIFYSGWAAINSVASRLVFNVMPSILGIVSDSENIATFSFISQLEGYVYLFSNVMGGFFLPKIARLKEENSREKIDKLAIKIAKMQLYLIGLVFVGFVCCGNDFVNLWLKHDASASTIYLGTVLIVSYQLIFVPQVVYYNEMYLSNGIKYLAVGSIIKAALNCVLAFLLGYFYGAIGAAISVAISRVFELIYVNFAYHKCLRVSILSFFKGAFLCALPAFVVSIGCSLPLALILDIGEIQRFLICGFTVVIVFSVLFYAFGLTKDEKNSILKLLRIKRGHL